MAPPMAIMLPHYSGMAEEDLDALVAYLKAVPPARHQVPDAGAGAEREGYLRRLIEASEGFAD